MAAGVPVVATAVGGVPEVVTSRRDAILVKKNDVAALASATSELLKDQQLRNYLVRSARQVVAQKSPQAYFESISSIFAQACTNGN
jgi:glycosyltransferase involved in cell wall biosynthesis